MVIKMLTVGPPEKKTKMERNKRTNSNRDPEKRNPHFSLTVELKRNDEARLQSLRSRLEHAKSLLGIDRKTSSTQNADFLERLLNCFELVMPSAVNVGPSSASSISSMPGRYKTQVTGHKNLRWVRILVRIYLLGYFYLYTLLIPTNLMMSSYFSKFKFSMSLKSAFIKIL